MSGNVDNESSQPLTAKQHVEAVRAARMALKERWSSKPGSYRKRYYYARGVHQGLSNREAAKRAMKPTYEGNNLVDAAKQAADRWHDEPEVQAYLAALQAQSASMDDVTALTLQKRMVEIVLDGKAESRDVINATKVAAQLTGWNKPREVVVSGGDKPVQVEGLFEKFAAMAQSEEGPGDG